MQLWSELKVAISFGISGIDTDIDVNAIEHIGVPAPLFLSLFSSYSRRYFVSLFSSFPIA
jgi:hypothetical protein